MFISFFEQRHHMPILLRNKKTPLNYDIYSLLVSYLDIRNNVISLSNILIEILHITTSRKSWTVMSFQCTQHNSAQEIKQSGKKDHQKSTATIAMNTCVS